MPRSGSFRLAGAAAVDFAEGKSSVDTRTEGLLSAGGGAGAGAWAGSSGSESNSIADGHCPVTLLGIVEVEVEWH